MSELKLQEITPVFVDSVPKEMVHGILYISDRFQMAIHLCACGCMEETVTPLSKDRWSLSKKNDKVSLTPSIGNFKGENPYHAHYYITENKIIWC